MKIKPFSSMPTYTIRYTKHAAERMKMYGLVPSDAIQLLKESVQAILPHNFKLKSKYDQPGEEITRWENGFYYINVARSSDKYTHKDVWLILTIFDKRLSIDRRNYNL